MLTKASKCPTNIMQDVANFVCKRENFLKENLPLCGTLTEVIKALAASDLWFVLADGQPTAVFKLETHGRTAMVSQICMNSGDSLETVISGLRGELREMRINELTLRVAPNEVEQCSASGFERGPAYVRFSRVPTESNMMPILPLTNITQKELPILSELMYTAYAKTDCGFSDIQSAEALLRTIMSGGRGQYLSNASFASGTRPNLVSACLLTVDSPGEAKIEQLFTHPLYRARGFATTEIAAAMNRLATSSVNSLTAWNREGNDVVRRLLIKMGFRQDPTVIEMTGGI